MPHSTFLRSTSPHVGESVAPCVAGSHAASVGQGTAGTLVSYLLAARLDYFAQRVRLELLPCFEGRRLELNQGYFRVRRQHSASSGAAAWLATRHLE
jgi:hypothetical protein